MALEPPSRTRSRETLACRGIPIEEKKVLTGCTLHLYRVEAKK
jgi:hypothetical protein